MGCAETRSGRVIRLLGGFRGLFVWAVASATRVISTWNLATDHLVDNALISIWVARCRTSRTRLDVFFWNPLPWIDDGNPYVTGASFSRRAAFSAIL